MPVFTPEFCRSFPRILHEETQVAHAYEQQLSRLRYETSLAQRQFLRVDPENRLVAAELEKRWEAALSELKRAEEAAASSTPSPSPLLALPEDMQAAFRAIGQHLPDLWRQGRIKPVHQKALLRCLIDLAGQSHLNGGDKIGLKKTE